MFDRRQIGRVLGRSAPLFAFAVLISACQVGQPIVEAEPSPSSASPTGRCQAHHSQSGDLSVRGGSVSMPTSQPPSTGEQLPDGGRIGFETARLENVDAGRSDVVIDFAGRGVVGWATSVVAFPMLYSDQAKPVAVQGVCVVQVSLTFSDPGRASESAAPAPTGSARLDSTGEVADVVSYEYADVTQVFIGTRSEDPRISVRSRGDVLVIEFAR